MSTPDDDALTWAGDPDRDTTNITWSAPKAGKASATSDRRLSRPRSGRIETPVSRRKSDGFDTPTASATQPAISANVELIVSAAFAAVYLLITVAWLIVALRNPLTIGDPLGNAMFTLGLWAAVAAGPLACGGIVVLAKHLSLLKRSMLFVLGILVLIPWPYLGWAS
ncbi:MAG: hypothetical protein K9H50_04840 [Aurantimicrobium sp.]|nr:hypothetical protein [Aurantimicrobium sp.]